MWKRLKRPCAISMILMSVAACETSSLGGDFCLIARPIYLAPEDTEATKRQIDEHNSKGEAVCGW